MTKTKEEAPRVDRAKLVEPAEKTAARCAAATEEQATIHAAHHEALIARRAAHRAATDLTAEGRARMLSEGSRAAVRTRGGNRSR